MFFIAEGTAVVETKRDHVELGPGQFFGELALMKPDAIRTARVRAKTPLALPGPRPGELPRPGGDAPRGRRLADRGRARPPGRERRRCRRLAQAQWAGVQPVGRQPRRAADAPARGRPAHGAAARVPPPARPKDEALALAHAIEEVKERVRFCRECGNLTEEEICAICRDARRDHTIVCVVEQPVDLISLERTHEYRGLYHVLGGSLSPLDGVEPEHLRIDELLGRVERNGVEEVVLATNPNMTGEATAAYLADRLRGRVRVTRLASGLPVGADLEYADEVTLGGR